MVTSTDADKVYNASPMVPKIQKVSTGNLVFTAGKLSLQFFADPSDTGNAKNAFVVETAKYGRNQAVASLTRGISLYEPFVIYTHHDTTAFSCDTN